MKEHSDSPPELVELDGENFESIVRRYPHVVIDCWAPWCGPCLGLEPTIAELASDYEGAVLFAKLNTDENLEIARKLGVMSLPTLLYFRNGKYEDRIIGGLQKRAIREKIDELIGSR